MAGNEISRLHQVSGTDGLFPETQMRCSQRTGLFGIIYKIALYKIIRFIPDDLDGILIGAYRTVCTQSEEQPAEFMLCIQVKFLIVGQT